MSIICSAAAQAGDHQQEIIKVNSLKEMEPYFEKTDSNSLVIFDIDSTITTPSDKTIQRQTIRCYKKYYDLIFNDLTENEKRIFLHLVVIDSPSMLVEEQFPAIIDKLQKNMVKTIAYTASKTGSLGSMESFPQWRYNELQRLGIDFSATFPKKVLFKEIPDLNGDFPGMEMGIAYSGYANSKGKILPMVLSNLNFKITKIIFIDDKLANIQSILKVVNEKYPVSFLGIHYCGINNIAKSNIEFNVFKQKILNLVNATKVLCKNHYAK